MRSAVLLSLPAVVACVSRVDTTRVTLRDPGELAVAGSGSLPAASGALGLHEHDVVLLGKPADVLAFDAEELHMHLVSSSRRGPLDLRLDTPLANVTSVRAVGVVASHSFIPLGVLAGCLLTGLGGAILAYDLDQHASMSVTTPAIAMTAGLAILALEIRARLARDTVTVIRGPDR